MERCTIVISDAELGQFQSENHFFVTVVGVRVKPLNNFAHKNERVNYFANSTSP